MAKGEKPSAIRMIGGMGPTSRADKWTMRVVTCTVIGLMLYLVWTKFQG